MSKSKRKIAVLGGSGFIGSHLVPALVRAGHQVTIITRKNRHQIPWHTYLQVGVITTDPTQLDKLKRALAGHDTLINLIGIIRETKKDTFKSAHFQVMTNLVNCARALNIHRLLHLSAMRADASHGPSRYLRSKGEVDQYLHTYFHNKSGVTIFRPSVVFGRGDQFVCYFARLFSRYLPAILPILPLPRARTRLAPVYVGDLVNMMVDSLDNQAYFGRDVEVCGPRAYTLAELMSLIGATINKKPIVIKLPNWLGRLLCMIMEILPGGLMTTDQFDSLSVDNLSPTARGGRTHLTSVMGHLIDEIHCHDPFFRYRRTDRK